MSWNFVENTAISVWYVIQNRLPMAFKIETRSGRDDYSEVYSSAASGKLFVHGVDHKRKDNVISIKVRRVGEAVEIRVQENGRGMEPSQLQRIQQMLSHRDPREEVEESKGRQSIGIVNVHERFLLYFGDRYHIQITSEKGKGVLYTITIEDA